ncbi:hypothetical protein B0H66DRAFT_538240 [Apodospora peruviana]|uniref:Uncharacterized protein n=1 Tax=Apodospora peruviana TaxID=516989 RepID=A0AAE0HUV6_9PEZI|nr:hypothetical protein B0H66DRAFT_538240 [Apodospora peruviana]
MLGSLTTFLSAALAVSASNCVRAAEPTPPPLSFLYSVKLLMPPTVELGSVPYGSRGIIPINGGTFSGPKLNGTVGIGLDWGLTDNKGTFSPDAVYVLNTHDNATIMVTEKGHAPHVQILFETGSSKYAWLNNIVAYASGAPFEGGVALDVWQIGA